MSSCFSLIQMMKDQDQDRIEESRLTDKDRQEILERKRLEEAYKLEDSEDHEEKLDREKREEIEQDLGIKRVPKPEISDFY